MGYVTCANLHDWVMTTNNYGRKKIIQSDTKRLTGFIRMFYGSRALEWINIRKVFQELLVLFQFAHLCLVVDDITIAWSYGDNLSSVFYRPSVVFKLFLLVDLLDEGQQCMVVTRTFSDGRTDGRMIGRTDDGCGGIRDLDAL
jgi:hypothetical protein